MTYDEIRSPFSTLSCSARLISILDFIFAETTLIEPSAWLADCRPTTDLRDDLPSRSRILALLRMLVATRQENQKSPAFDNVYSVPVQAALHRRWRVACLTRTECNIIGCPSDLAGVSRTRFELFMNVCRKIQSPVG